MPPVDHLRRDPAAAAGDGRGFFDRLRWQADRMLLDDLVFHLEEAWRDRPVAPGTGFRFYKTRRQVEAFAAFFARRAELRARRIVELGIWDGGSVAFWSELFHPERHLALDLAEGPDGPDFLAWRARRGLESRVTTHWRIDQGRRDQVLELVRREHDGPLDLVVDDASHLYEATLASFEVLFPLLCPGGLFLIEDWSWAHWPEYQDPAHPWTRLNEPTHLVCALVEAAGSDERLIPSIHLEQSFVAVERGPLEIADPLAFRLDDHVRRRPPSPLRTLPG